MQGKKLYKRQGKKQALIGISKSQREAIDSMLDLTSSVRTHSSPRILYDFSICVYHRTHEPSRNSWRPWLDLSYGRRIQL